MAGKGFFKTLKSFSYAAAVGAAMMAAALFAGAALASCDNLGDGYDAPSVVAGGQNGGPSNGGTVTAPGAQTAGGQAAQVGECLTAYVSLPSLPTLSGNAPLSENVARYAGLSNDSAQSTGDVSKSAFPNIADAADTAYSFEAELAIAGGATYTADGSYNGTTGKCSFSFAGAKSAEERTYTLTVSLYHTSGTPATKSLVASASQSVTVGADEASFAASVQLAPNLDSAPNGSLSLPIKFSDTSVSSVKLMLLNSAGTDVTATYLDGLTGTTLNLTSGAGTIASKDGGLPAGTYTLLMTFMKGTVQVGARTESLNIYPTMQTKLWWSKDGMAESATTALNVTQFDQKEFWIRGTGGVFYSTIYTAETATALDTNVGSFAFPLKTIQEAVDRIVASGDTISQFTVYIDGKIEGDPDADYTSNQSSLVRMGATSVPFKNKILIKGWTGPDTDIVDVKKSKDSVNKARAFYISADSSAKVTIKDLRITHGAASGIGGGFYILSCADMSLENCKISECYAASNYNGGGIYMSKSTVVLKKCVVTQSEAQKGGGVYAQGSGTGASEKSNLTIENSEISANTAYSGGGVYVGIYATLNFLSGQISANTANYSSTITNSGMGGGIYIDSGKCFISGSAVVGQSLAVTSSAATSSNGSHSNKATQGGGICNHGVLYLGYTDDSTPAAWTGSVCYNYATDDGGGIISSGNSAIFKMNSGSVAYNACGANGGGVYLSSAKLAMSGDGAIPAGADGKHDVYLHNGAAIDVPEAIASTITTAATITPASYTADTVVLTGSALSASQCGKFAVTQPSGAGIPWSIKYDNSSGTAKGVLKQSRSAVYVAAESAGGSDSNDGTIDHPYATIQEAVKHFSDKTPSLGATSDPGYPNFENKVYILSNMTFDVGAGADGNAYNFEIVACNDKTVGKNVTLTFNTESGSGLYVAYGQKVKLTNIDITQSSATENKYAAIMVENNASGKGELWMENCSVKNMTAKDCSAIAAKNDVHLKNVTVTGNTTKVELASATATVYGPAVYSDKGTIHIEGTIVVKDNTVDYTVSGSSVTGSKVQNLWIGENTGSSPEFHKLDITGALTGSDIGVTLYDNSKTFTSYFNSSGSSDPADFFKSDEGWNVVLDGSGNAMLQAPTTIYVAAMTAVPAGSDIIGNGSALLPYATVQKAVSRIEELNDSTKDYTIQVGVGSFAAATCIDSSGTLGPKPIASRITIVGNSKTTTTLRKAATGTAAILSLVDVGVPITLQKIGFAGGDATGAGGAIDATRTSTGTFDLTITDCNFSLNKASSKGGAIYLSGSVSCTINDTAFGQNYTTSTESLDGNGGAIYVGSGASLYVGSSTSGSTTFTANTANNGGAIYNEGKCFVYGSTVIGNKNASSYAQEATTMHSNSATTYGGGIYNKGQLYLGYSSWTSPSVNTATTLTGGVYYNYAVAGAGIFNDTSSSVVINSGSVSKNGSSPTGGGGGLFNQGTLDIKGGSVDNNFGGAMGGGILVNTDTTISGTATISENSATDGAGVYIFENKLTMNGGSVSSNIATQTGGGIYVSPGTSGGSKGIFEFNDGTISQNKALQGAGVADLSVMNMAGGTISQNQANGAVAVACGGGVLVNSVQADPFTMTGGSIEGNSSEGSGGGLYIFNGECSISDGTISGNTAAAFGGGIFVDQGKITDGATTTTYKGQLNLSGDATIPPGTEGKNDIALFNSLGGAYSENSIKVTGALSASNVAKIMPGIYGSGVKVLDGTPALVSASHSKFTVADYVDAGVTTKWAVGPTGYLSEVVSGGGTIVIHTPEGDLNLAASATTIDTSETDTTITISAKNASGTDITSSADVTWNGVTVYYGAEEIDSKADTNSYEFKKTFPKGTYRLNVSVTYKGTTYSDSFTITKTVEGAANPVITLNVSAMTSDELTAFFTALDATVYTKDNPAKITLTGLPEDEWTHGDYSTALDKMRAVAAAIRSSGAYIDLSETQLPDGTPLYSNRYDTGGDYSSTTAPERRRGLFYNCAKLVKAPQLPVNNTTASGKELSLDYAFSGCTNLTEIPDIPAWVNDLYGTFESCASLEDLRSVTIPCPASDELEDTFLGCTGLKYPPAIAEGVTWLSNTFGRCESLLTAPTIPNSVTQMSFTFQRCTSLTNLGSMNIPSGVTNLDSCFIGCTSLTVAPNIPNAVSDMDSCFNGCKDLTRAPVIPASVTTIDRCFAGCESLGGNVVIKASINDSADWLKTFGTPNALYLTPLNLGKPSGMTIYVPAAGADGNDIVNAVINAEENSHLSAGVWGTDNGTHCKVIAVPDGATWPEP